MSIENDEIIILTGEEKAVPFTDLSKEPKKIYMDYITGDEDDELTPIWAEKADYINEERLGEGLENKIEYLDEKNRTFNLSIKPASREEIGGVKLGESLKINDEGVVDVNPNTVIGPASQTELGGVRIGPGIHCDQYGTISVDEYVLPMASEEELGGIRVGDGLGIDNGYLRVVCKALSNNSNLTDEEKELVNLGLTNIDFVISVLLRLINEQNKTVNALTERINSYVDKTPDVQGVLESGRNVFGGNWDPINREGGTVVNLDKNYEGIDYFVLITPCCSTMGEIGDYFVRDKTSKSFRVCNTGSVNMDEFCWMVVPSNIIYNIEAGGSTAEIENQLPIKFGRGKFNSKEVDTTNAFNTISFDRQMPNVNYVVFVTPVVQLDGNDYEIGQPHLGNLGEICVVNKLSTEFTVLNTGSDKETHFDWIAIPFDIHNEDFNYDSFIFPVHVGTINIVDGSEPMIRFSNFKFNNKDFKVFLQLSSNANGQMGELYVDNNEKTRTSFKIEHTGDVLQYSVDWITVD